MAIHVLLILLSVHNLCNYQILSQILKDLGLLHVSSTSVSKILIFLPTLSKIAIYLNTYVFNT